MAIHTDETSADNRGFPTLSIPRIHAFELEDQPWFPITIRDLATDFLRFIQTTTLLQGAIVKVLGKALRSTNSNHVVDLCSGAGGPVPNLQKALANAGVRVSFTLTDRFPNVPAFAATASKSSDAIDYVTAPVDARAVPKRCRGFRTLFNAFHHFKQDDAVAVLRDAVRVRDPIGIFEISDRRLMTFLVILVFMPVLVLLLTPFIRPFRWQRLFWTYLVPVVPLTCWWDGIVSQLRAYSPDELQGLASKARGHEYSWEAGQMPVAATPCRLTYLLGTPL